jgi:predicted ATPase with chaperone activity
MADHATVPDPYEPRAGGSVISTPIPQDIGDLGVPEPMVIDIALRRAMLDGQTSTLRLAESLCVTPMLMEHIIESMRHMRYVEVRGVEGRNQLLALTDHGHEQAMERMDMCRYAGPIPVSLRVYTEVVEAQQATPDIDHELVRAAFEDLVMSNQLLDELGPAIRSHGAIFLYGPPGTGKSAIAERLIRVHTDNVVVPHAVEVDGQIITLFDPVLHRPIDPQPTRLDRRWVACRRPSVIVGGELTASQLDLTYESNSGIYLASLQMQANNGVLVIDDFGRQIITPEELLNRWIVPLDRSIDYLSLEYGVKFQVPCLTKIVFSTNLEPASLADEAFFRRIRSKVLIPPIDDEQFDEVLRRVSLSMEVTVSPDAPEYLRQASRERGDGDLRPYLPGAVCELVRSISGYEHQAFVLDRPMIDRVVDLYFTQDRAMQHVGAKASYDRPRSR